jgi:nucleoside-diphosphate-sugar epimerase
VASRAERYLVTGASGFLGSYVVDALRQRGGEVTALQRSGSPGDEVICADLTSDDLDLRGKRFDGIFHLAGHAHRVPRSDQERRVFFAVNVEGTRRLLRSLEDTRSTLKGLVLVSSVSVYGIEAGQQIAESTPCEATDPYGRSKREAEMVALEWSQQTDVPLVIVRLPLVIGYPPPGNLGALVHALQSGWYFGIGHGAARRSMVLARDVAQFVPCLAGRTGVYHLCDGYHPSFLELETALSGLLGRRQPRRLPEVVTRWGARLGDAIERFCGRPMPLNSHRLRKITSTLTFSDERARHDLGWNPRPVLENLGEVSGR